MDFPPIYLILVQGFLLPLVPHWEVLLHVDLHHSGILHLLLVVLPGTLFLEMEVLVALFLVEGLVDLAQWPYVLLHRLDPSFIQ